ncbi:MAG: tetratricopeptide repeat protein [Steroidobacteraceae bacterium]
MARERCRSKTFAVTATLLPFIFAAGCVGHARVPDDAAARGDRDAASQLYDGQPAVVHATEYPVASAADGIARGDAAWRAGKLDLAVYLYVQSLAFDATSPDPYLKIAAIHERLGNRRLAETAFERAFALDPDNAGTNERLGLLYLQDGRDDAARVRFERAIALDPSRWQSHNGLGIAADRRFNFAAAIAHYDAAFAIEPRAAMVVNNRGYSRYLARDFAGAEADYRIALALGAQSGTWTNLGKAQARQGRYAEAMESLRKENGEAQAYNLLGEVALESDDLNAAQEQFTLALSASPRYFQAARENLDLVNKRIAEEALRQTQTPAGDSSMKPAAVAHAENLVAMRASYVTYSPAQYRAAREQIARKQRPAANGAKPKASNATQTPTQRRAMRRQTGNKAKGPAAYGAKPNR